MFKGDSFSLLYKLWWCLLQNWCIIQLFHVLWFRFLWMYRLSLMFTALSSLVRVLMFYCHENFVWPVSQFKVFPIFYSWHIFCSTVNIVTSLVAWTFASYQWHCLSNMIISSEDRNISCFSSINLLVGRKWTFLGGFFCYMMSFFPLLSFFTIPLYEWMRLILLSLYSGFKYQNGQGRLSAQLPFIHCRQVVWL
jgi:hypothetical protein